VKHGWHSPSKRGRKARAIPRKGGVEAGYPKVFQFFLDQELGQWDHTAVLLSKQKKNENPQEAI